MYESHVHVYFIVLWCVCTVQVCDQKLVLVARGAGRVDRGVRNALESHDGSPEGGRKIRCGTEATNLAYSLHRCTLDAGLQLYKDNTIRRYVHPQCSPR